ncbi:MAG: RNA 3'-terminal phosphate cyclase [bacterium]
MSNSPNWIRIDGSFGEGGGQILRTSLALSLITGKPFEISNIRANRPNPGLAAQHLQCVRAAGKIGEARVEGAEIGSSRLRFEPTSIVPGSYKFEIPTAGAASLVLQTVFLPLCLADSPSEIEITGGTHIPWSPSYHYLELQWLPFVRAIGCDLELNLIRAGFYPQGGGRIAARIRPMRRMSPMEIPERGELEIVGGISAISNLDIKIAKRQRERAERNLAKRGYTFEIGTQELPSHGRGTMLLLLGRFRNSACCYFGLGARGKPAEEVADEACESLFRFAESEGTIDEYLADQLLLPLALAPGRSRFRTPRVTQHLLTNAECIGKFLSSEISIDGELGYEGEVIVEGIGVVSGR